MHKCLVADVRLAGMLDTHPCFIFPLYVLPDRPLQSMLKPWSPGAGYPRCRPPQHGDPRRPGVVWRFPGRRPRLFDLMLFVLAFLRQPCIPCVCTQILLLPLSLCSRAVVFEPSWPLSCIKQLVLFYLESCVVISHRESLISIVYLACMITEHGLILGASQIAMQRMHM